MAITHSGHKPYLLCGCYGPFSQTVAELLDWLNIRDFSRTRKNDSQNYSARDLIAPRLFSVLRFRFQDNAGALCDIVDFENLLSAIAAATQA